MTPSTPPPCGGDDLSCFGTCRSSTRPSTRPAANLGVRGALARSADGDAIDAQRRLADADRHALSVLAAGTDTVVEREVVADHGDTVQIGRSVADQHGALDRRALLAVLDAISLGAFEYVFARRDIDLAAAEMHGVDSVLH